MPRFIDDIRADGKFYKPWWVLESKEREWAAYAAKCWEIIETDIPVIKADNVAEYFYSESDQEYWDLSRDFPNFAPPWPQFWIEHKFVKTIKSKECGETDVTAITADGRIGMLFSVIKPEDAVTNPRGAIPEKTKWIYWMDMWMDWGTASKLHGHAHGPTGATFMCVDETGALIEKPWMQTYCSPDARDAMRGYMSWYNPAFLAISFLHCGNVTVEDHQVDKPLAKKWSAKHNGIRPVGYKILVIEPLKQILRNKGRVHEQGLAKAMHICRGHFADYREGRGLFGKYKKLVWIPQTIKGTGRKGEQPEAPTVEVKI
jgi:hypothetical protein